jgi:Cu/Ag efflux pump CusA
MMAWLIGSAMTLRRLVVALLVVMLGLGLVQLHNARVDLYPEFDPTQVQVQAEALGLSANEVEQLITVPIEQDLLNGVPWLKSIRSRSMPGLSSIDLVFEPGTDLYQARQMVQERMSQAKALPNVGTPPAVIQPTSSTSRVAMVGLTSSSVSLIEMSVLARWQIRPRLMSIPGVAQVSIWGQQDRQLQVQVDPARLQAKHVTLTQLIETTGNALWVSPLSFVEASTPGTGGFVETPNQRLGVQHVSPIATSKELADVAVERGSGPAVRLGDVASVVEDHQPLIGDATDDGKQGLMLVVERFPGADTAKVTRDVDAALASMGPGLRGITVDTSVYRPARYLDSAVHRLAIAGLIGGILLLLVIGLITWSWRVAVVAMASVAASVMAALWIEYLRGGVLTSMTLIGLAGAMALVIDDAVGDTSALRARLRRREDGQPGATEIVTRTVAARRAPLMYATIVALLALGPLFLLSGPAGALVRPAVLTLALAVTASLLTALVFTPVLSVMLFGRAAADGVRSGGRPAGPSRLLDRLPLRSMVRPGVAGAVLAVLALLAVPALLLLQPGDTLPAAQDRSVVVNLEAAPGTALPEMNRISTAAAAELRGLDGVREVGTHVGRAIASDRVTDVNRSEIWLTIADDANYADTMGAIRSTVHGYPGLRSDVTTYAAERLADAGTTTGDGLLVRVYGNDLAKLRSTAEDVRQQIQTVAGVISPTVQAQVTEPTVEIQVDLEAARRAGLRPGDVRRDASTLVSGLTVGSLYEQQAIFDVVLWGGAPTRESLASLQSLLIDTPSGGHVRLGDVAAVRIAATPSVITHDAVSRSLDVVAQVRGRSAAAVSEDVTTQLRRMEFPYEYHAEVVGDAVDRAANRQWIVVGGIVAALLSLLLLQSATGSWRGAAVLLVLAPFAAVGGLVAAQFMGRVLTGGVLAALVAATALALRQALSLVRRAQICRSEGVPAVAALTTAVREAAPAVLATALATAALFLPAAVMGDGPGLELLHSFAIALLAALVTSAALVLFVVPGLYPALAGLAPLPIPPDIPDQPDPGAGEDSDRSNAGPALSHDQREEQR